MASIYKTPRQEEIAAAAARSLGLKPSDVTAIATEFDLPTSITYSNDSGSNITRDIRPYYGELLTDGEYRQLIQERKNAAASQSLESLNGYDQLLGQAKKPVSIESSNLVKQDTSNSNTFDSSQNRLASAGLTKGAQNTAGGTSPIIKFKNSNGSDHRVRILVPAGGPGFLLNSPITSPLRDTGGVLFPYTPTITVNHSASYDAAQLTHSNYAYQFYQSSMVEEISITGTFASKNSTDALYVIAAQHFFRTVTKMFYGQDELAGTPPPVLRLDGHGDLQFSSVPIVITSFSSSFPDDVDYISTGSATASQFRAAESSPFTAGQMDGSTRDLGRVPVIQTFTIGCRPVYSRKSISGEFGLTKFAAGQLLGTRSRGGYL